MDASSEVCCLFYKFNKRLTNHHMPTRSCWFKLLIASDIVKSNLKTPQTWGKTERKWERNPERNIHIPRRNCITFRKKSWVRNLTTYKGVSSGYLFECTATPWEGGLVGYNAVSSGNSRRFPRGGATLLDALGKTHLLSQFLAIVHIRIAWLGILTKMFWIAWSVA